VLVFTLHISKIECSSLSLVQLPHQGLDRELFGSFLSAATLFGPRLPSSSNDGEVPRRSMHVEHPCSPSLGLE